jgi:hypothetical protein
MGEKSELIASMLVNKTPDQIERLFKGVERSLRYEADEAAEQAQKQAAEVEAMSLEAADRELNRAIERGDLASIAKWGPIHRRKLAWVTDQVQADREAELERINKPALEQKQARRQELEGELAALTQPGAQIDFDRIGAVHEELRGLS